ncbi:MAG: DUF3160 domain-containing protein [Anaerolineae bacterium]|nr:DUF3160 domain-containing protein [Anaerolineae bacterium]
MESYFRGMMWLSRITFRAKYDDETLTGLLLLRALRTAPDAYATWQSVSDILAFLIGPVDDLGPPEYAPLADEVFGADMSLASLSDASKLADFRARVEALPGPRINSLVLPASTDAEDVEAASRGFRLMGQRFTLDSYVLQRLMFPYVGTDAQPRVLPLGLDIPAANGSSLAADLIAQAGADDFVNYDAEMSGLRQQITSLTANDWLENTYGGWLWTLQPLWMRDPAGYPPLMRTDAWLRRDLNAGLASWTELRHDTVLYVKQPTGFGGGGPPLASYGYVEPNPLVFARIAIVAGLLYQGLDARGVLDPDRFFGEPVGLMTDMDALRELAVKAGSFADAALRELTDEPLDDDTYYAIQTYGTYLDVLLRTLYQGSGTPDPVALVTDVASNTTTQQVLQEGVGGVDYIYVVIPAPGDRLQVARGAVFSYYEFVGDINERMTDAEWRERVVNGSLPPRPDWTAAYLSD